MVDHWSDIFYQTVNSHWYMNNIQNPFFQQLTAEKRKYGYFQQDNATAHTAGDSADAIHEVFDDRMISKGLWPPRSQILVVVIFISGGT
jgi:hypothetical protein